MEQTPYNWIQRANVVLFEEQIVKSRYPIGADKTMFSSVWNGLQEYEIDNWDEEKGILTIKRKTI